MNSKAPIVSIVIPTYNAPSLLEETLQSVFAQTLTDFEILVIDDGSTDSTPEFLRRLDDPRLRVIRQENRGIGGARNRGLDEATGSYVALLDHDDLWLPKKLEVQVEFMESHPQCAGVVVPFAQSSHPDVAVVDPRSLVGSDGVVHRPFRKLAAGQTFLLTSALMIRRSSAAGAYYGLVRGAIEDVPFHIQLLNRGSIGMAGDQVLAIHRDHGSNVSRQASYYYLGQIELRRMDTMGTFAASHKSDTSDIREYLAALGRASIMRQAVSGRRAKALCLYMHEFPHQLRLGRFRFLVGFPFRWLLGR